METISAKGPALLITVDCGVNYPEEVALAKASGLEVIVVDHHQPGPVLPDCHLVHEVAGEYPHGTLCGVGLALKVLHGVHMRRCGAAADRLPPGLMAMLDLVAVGTIADLAALVGENRYYVREGLKLVAIGQRVGLRALAQISGCTGSTDSSTVAYRLAPRLNAAGRLADPTSPLRLLLTSDEQEAAALAQQLHELNTARQDVERQILEQAIEEVDRAGAPPPVIVLAGKEWHEGVVGIVAARLVERYHRPAILLGVRDGVAKGSGRSIGRYDIMQGLNACAEHLTVFGGHPQAVGLTLEAERVGDFRTAIENHASLVLDPRDLVPTFRGDAVLCGDDVTADTALALNALGPFGSGNPKPRLMLVGADLQQVETTRDGSHLRCNVRVDGVRVRGIGFGMGKDAAALQTDGVGRLLGVQFQVDTWQGSLRPEFVIDRIGAAPLDGGRLFDCGPGTEAWQAVWAEEPTAREPLPPAGNGATGARPALPSNVARDLRDRPGRTSALAQILCSGERAVVVGCSLPHMLKEPLERLPFTDLCRGGLAFATSAAGARSFLADGRPAGADAPGGSVAVLMAEWDALLQDRRHMDERVHLVAVDPPYRAGHLGLLEQAGRGGANVHLLYGAEERGAAAKLLRYLVHPRFAMVCVYRALESCRADEGQPDEGVVLESAARMAWEEARVVMPRESLRRALSFLEELRVDDPRAGEAKLDARSIAAYAQAEAEYEECSRLCQTL